MVSDDKYPSYYRMDTQPYCDSVDTLIEPWYVWMLSHDSRIALGRNSADRAASLNILLQYQ